MIDSRTLKTDLLRSEYIARGEPFYALDLVQLRNDYHRTVEAFCDAGVNICISYSYKTNYLRSICSELDSMGCFAEVVSPFEVKMACKYGVSPSRIIYNGPVKDDESVRTVLAGGGVVNLDNEADLKIVQRVKSDCKSGKWKIGIRVSFPVGSLHSSRFGVDMDSGAYQDLLKAVLDDSDLKLVSLMCHFPNRDVASYRERTKRMTAEAAKLPTQVDTLDIGGGFCSEFSKGIASQLGFVAPTIEEYAHAIAEELQLADAYEKYRIMIEPGTLLSANCLHLVGGVKTVKENQSVRYFTLDISKTNLGGLAKKVSPDFRNLSRNGNADGSEGFLVGFTCVEGDVIAPTRGVPMDIGDVLMFPQMGSYSMVFKPPFIRGDLSVLEWDGETIRECRRVQTVEDVVERDIFGH